MNTAQQVIAHLVWIQRMVEINNNTHVSDIKHGRDVIIFLNVAVNWVQFFGWPNDMYK